MSKKGSFSLFRQGHRDWLRSVLGKQERGITLHLILLWERHIIVPDLQTAHWGSERLSNFPQITQLRAMELVFEPRKSAS